MTRKLESNANNVDARHREEVVQSSITKIGYPARHRTVIVRSYCATRKPYSIPARIGITSGFRAIGFLTVSFVLNLIRAARTLEFIAAGIKLSANECVMHINRPQFLVARMARTSITVVA